MGRVVMVFAVLVIATEATAWARENSIGGQRLDLVGGETDWTVRRLASGGVTLPTAPIATETKETTPPAKPETQKKTTPPAKPTVRVDPANEETQAKADSSPQLDLDALEKRLRQTDALGFFTKLSLKNQVNDLLSQFRAYHKGTSDLTIEQLRERYNLLLLKLVSLLEDDDAQLSHDILASHGALWNVLADPEQFAKLQES